MFIGGAMKERHILSIDLKSFFASCECVLRGLDPFTTPLVVANSSQGNGAITLAVTPYLKKQGVPSRGRIYEIPKNIKYYIANPRMSSYIKFSEQIVSIYLDYISKEDLHVYSIDECFLDVTNYLELYKKTDYELAKEILSKIYDVTHLTATCGIGPNILIAKVAMDIEAKHKNDGIAKWTKDDIKTKLWNITPLSKMWGIGPRMEKRLNNLGIYKVGDLANYDKYKLKSLFGIMGLELAEHANGIDNSVISSLKNSQVDKSYSNSQVLFKNYNGDNIRIIIGEMVDLITKRLRTNNKQTLSIGLAIGYSRNIGGGFYRTIKVDTPTDSNKLILNTCMLLFDRYYNGSPIRKVGVSVGRLTEKTSYQLNIFEDFESVKKEENKNKTIDYINSKFGKNSLLRASSLLDNSTIRERNKKIGGHNA